MCSGEVVWFFLIFMFVFFVETLNYLTLYNSFLYSYADIVCTFCTFCLVWGLHRIYYTFFGVKRVNWIFLFWHSRWIQNITVKEAKFLYLMILYCLCDKTCVFYSWWYIKIWFCWNIIITSIVKTVTFLMLVTSQGTHFNAIS